MITLALIASKYGLSFSDKTLSLSSYAFNEVVEISDVKLKYLGEKQAEIEIDKISLNLVDNKSLNKSFDKSIDETKNSKKDYEANYLKYRSYIKNYIKKIKVNNIVVNYKKDKISFSDLDLSSLNFISLERSSESPSDSSESVSLKNLQYNNTEIADELKIKNISIGANKFSSDLSLYKKKNNFLNANLKSENKEYFLNYQLNKQSLKEIENILPRNMLPKYYNKYFKTGFISAKGTLNKNKITTNLKISALSGAFKDYKFKSAALSYHGEVYPKIKNPIDVYISEFDAGIIFNDIKFKLEQVSKKEFNLSQIEAGVLSGKIYIPLFKALRKNNIILTGKNISLDQISKLYSKKGYNVTGKLDFTMPIQIDSDSSFSSDNGIFSGHYGLIKISDQRLAAITEPSLKKVYNLLKDFNYNKLSGTFSYSKEGDLKVLANLFGKSANVERPIDFNLNFEDNIPKLLKSIKLAKGKFK